MKVWVVDNGAVVARGPPLELATSSPHFQRLLEHSNGSGHDDAHVDETGPHVSATAAAAAAAAGATTAAAAAAATATRAAAGGVPVDHLRSSKDDNDDKNEDDENEDDENDHEDDDKTGNTEGGVAGSAAAEALRRGRLTGAEKRHAGAVAASSYRRYLASSGARGGTVWTTLLLFPLAVALDCGQSYWLGLWAQSSASSGNSSDGDPSNSSSNSSSSGRSYVYFLQGYGLLVACSFALLCLRGCLFARFIAGSSTALHNAALRALLRAPMAFFDTTPAGRILNRFSNDQVSAASFVITPFFLSRVLCLQASFYGLVG
jgi:ABC-type multidrug transport system fused ATPase/permease subunit